MDELTRQLAQNLQAMLLLQKEASERQLALERILVEKGLLDIVRLFQVIGEMRATQAAGRAVNEALGEKPSEVAELIAEVRRRLQPGGAP